MRESDLSRQVRSLLGILGQITEHDRWVGPGWIVWRENSGVCHQDRRYIRYGTPGIADFMGVIRGRPIAFELKGAKGVLRSTQRKFAKQFEAAGGVYVVVKKLEQIEEMLR